MERALLTVRKTRAVAALLGVAGAAWAPGVAQAMYVDAGGGATQSQPAGVGNLQLQQEILGPKGIPVVPVSPAAVVSNPGSGTDYAPIAGGAGGALVVVLLGAAVVMRRRHAQEIPEGRGLVDL